MKILAILLATTFLSVIGAQGQNLGDGAVYVMTNQTANAVMTFSRSAQTGKLTLSDTEPTHGAGNPIPIEPDPSVDPLASQGSLIVDEKGCHVYAVNAGSNDISVLAVEPGGLRFVQKISSGGTRPISLAIYRRWLYVLNDGVTPSITGFTVTFGGSLTPIPGSTCPLVGGPAADPAQIKFNNEGTMLVVSEKDENRFDIYHVDRNGVAGPPTAAPSHGTTPFGFAFGPRGQMFVAETFNGLPGASAVSSYDTSSALMLEPVSGSVRNSQGDTCWLEVTNDGSHVVVSSPGTGTLSTYAAGRDGKLTLLRGVAGFPGTETAPVDIALDPTDKFLYVLENGSHTISAWLLRHDGSLSLVGKFGNIPAGAQGIAVR